MLGVVGERWALNDFQYAGKNGFGAVARSRSLADSGDDGERPRAFSESGCLNQQRWLRGVKLWRSALDYEVCATQRGLDDGAFDTRYSVVSRAYRISYCDNSK